MMRDKPWIDLPNGFRAYIYPASDHHVGGVGVRFGGIHDPISFPGCAHVTEHMVARETKQFPKQRIDLLSREAGCGPWGGINIFTLPSHTFYGTDMLLRRSHMLELFDVFASMVTEATLTPEGLGSEKGAVLTEYLLHEKDSPEYEALALLLETMYQKNPVRKRFCCDASTLPNVPVSAIKEAIKRYYVANNMFAVIFGPDREKARRMINKWFRDLPSRDIPPLSYDGSESRPLIESIRSIEVERRGLSAHHMAIGFPTNPMNHEDTDTLDVLAEILEYRIESVIRDENTSHDRGTYHPQVTHDTSGIHGCLQIWFPAQNIEAVREGEEKIIRECERLKMGGFTENEVQKVIANIPEQKRRAAARRARKKLTEDFNGEVKSLRKAVHDRYVAAFRHEIGGLAEMVAHSAANGDPDLISLRTFRSRFSRITKTSIVRAANEYLTTPNRYVRILLKPES